jgi:hypothetical protein
MASGKVVRRIFFAADQLLGMEELPVRPGPDLVDHSRLQIKEHGSRDMLACSGLAEERVERIIASADGLVARHLSIGLRKQDQTKKSTISGISA